MRWRKQYNSVIPQQSGGLKIKPPSNFLLEATQSHSNRLFFLHSTGTFHTVKSEPIMRPRQHTNNNINADGTKTGFSFGRTPRFSEGDLQIQNSSNTNSSTPKQTDLAPVREGQCFCLICYFSCCIA